MVSSNFVAINKFIPSITSKDYSNHYFTTPVCAPGHLEIFYFSFLFIVTKHMRIPI